MAGIWSYSYFVSPVLEDAPVVADGGPGRSVSPERRSNEIPRLISTRPEATGGNADQPVSEKGENETRNVAKPVDPKKARRAESLFAVGVAAEKKNDLLAARSYLSEAVELGLAHQKLIDARAALVRIGSKTVFGTAIVPDDPFTDRYVIKPGESLGKIARKFSVTDDFLADRKSTRLNSSHTDIPRLPSSA